MKKSVLAIFFCVIGLSLFISCNKSEDVKDYPQEDILIYCQFGAGGGNDVQLRAIAPYLQAELPGNVNVVVDNKTGGGGIVCSNYVWAAKPDGYTLMQAQMGTMLCQQMYSNEISFDCNGYTWLGIYAFDKSVLVVRPDLEIYDWDDFVEYSKTHVLRMATAGVGSNTHVQAAMFLDAAGLDGNLVHYSDGTSAVVAAFGRGEVDAYIFSLGNQSIAAEKNGSVRTLCILQDERSELTPETPTLREIGAPDDIVADVLSNPIISAPRGFCAPPDLPKEVLDVLDEALYKALTSEEMIEWGRNNMLSWEPMNAEDTSAWVSKNLEYISEYKDVLKEIMT